MSAYAEYIIDHLSDWGPAQVKRMFGGHGIFRGGIMFALIADDQLYLKSDVESETRYREQGCDQFTYAARGKNVNLSYWSAPEEFFDDPDETIIWADLAFEAALRADAKKPKKSRRDTTKRKKKQS